MRRHPILERLFNADQAGRAAGPSANVDWQAVSKRARSAVAGAD